VAEDELVEVDLEVSGRDAAVGALEPRLEVGRGPVGAGQQLLVVRVVAPLQQGPVLVARAAELVVALPAIGVDDRSGRDERLHPRGEGGLARVRKHLQAQPTRAGSARLDGDSD
jgi:hypothetical protein